MNRLRELRKMYATGGVLGPDNVDPPNTKRKIDLSSVLSAFKTIDMNPGTIEERSMDLGLSGAPSALPAASPSTLEKFGGMAKSILPYASNILNSFRKVPAPPAPTLNPYATLNKVSFSDERAQVDRSGRVADVNSDRNLDENSAAAVKAFTRGQTMEKLSEVNNREKNTNIGIGNQQAQINSRTDEINNAKIDDYNAAKVGRKITQQNATSENLSNAVDKSIMIDTEKRKAKLEDDRTKTYSTMFKNSGVMVRNAMERQRIGLPESYKGEYSNPEYLAEKARMEDLDKKSNKKMFGGRLKKVY